MYLVLDNSSSDHIILALWTNNCWSERTYSTTLYELLAAIDDFLRIYGINSRDLHGIAVRVGVGAFTAARIAVTTANTIAYLLNIPVIAVPPKDNLYTNEIITRFKQAPCGVWLSAAYSGDPHIGGKRTVV